MVGVGRGALIGPARAGRARAGLRRPWGSGTLLVLAAGLRAVVSAAYQPALIFPDSVRYLQYAQHFADGRWTVDGLRQSGYSVLLVPVMLLHDLWVITLVQHLVGLATGMLVYAVLVRLEASHGEPGFTTFSGAFLYGRVADFASCQGLNLPGYERPLCPAQPPAQRNADFYTWDPRSPQWTFRPPAGMSRDAVVRDFGLRILRHQPLAYAQAAGRDFLYGFAPARGAGPERYSPAYLRFHPYIQPDRQADASLAALGYQPPRVHRSLASFLAGYGRWFYVPGPVFAGGLVLALAGLAAGTRRRDKRASAGLLFTASAVLVLIPPALFATFDWRYQLPQLTLIPVAAVIGAVLLTHPRSPRSASGGVASSPCA
ncbi:MAG: hypothetical protein ACRDP5_10950 [Streptosporangiaceae bacterium]